MIGFRRAIVLAFAAFALLYGARFADLMWRERDHHSRASGVSGGESFDIGRKNYASAKTKVEGQSLGDTQKFEKVATLTETTNAFEADRKRVDELIAADGALVQLENAQGLAGHRRLDLGIGVPPAKFDDFIEKARTIGKLTQLAIVKNDKTNEYLQLRAKRTTLESARAALQKLNQPDADFENKLNVLNRLTEIEQQIQDLGVSLGDFDAANELCTVKLTLSEAASAPPAPHAGPRVLRVAVDALVWTIPLYLMASIGLFILAFALFLGVPAVQRLYRQVKSASDA